MPRISSFSSAHEFGRNVAVAAVVSTGAMYAALSSTGKTAFTSTTAGNWFNVSSTDYAAVFSALSNVTKYCMTDTQLTEGNNGWSGGYAQAFGAGLNAQVSAGTYIIGFVTRTYSATGTATPLIGTTLPTSGSYSAIANSATISTAGTLQYYLRRAPTATAATSYLGLVGSATMESTTSVTGITNWFSSSGPPYTSWSTYNANPLIYQVLGTPTLQWT